MNYLSCVILFYKCTYVIILHIVVSLSLCRCDGRINLANILAGPHARLRLVHSLQPVKLLTLFIHHDAQCTAGHRVHRLSHKSRPLRIVFPIRHEKARVCLGVKLLIQQTLEIAQKMAPKGFLKMCRGDHLESLSARIVNIGSYVPNRQSSMYSLGQQVEEKVL